MAVVQDIYAGNEWLVVGLVLAVLGVVGLASIIACSWLNDRHERRHPAVMTDCPSWFVRPGAPDVIDCVRDDLVHQIARGFDLPPELVFPRPSVRNLELVSPARIGPIVDEDPIDWPLP